MQLEGKRIIYPFFLIPLRSQFKYHWDIFILIIVIYNSIFNPVEIAFELSGDMWFQVSNIVVSAIYVVDILLNMRTSYFDENNDEILDAKLIAKKYCESKYFVIDLITALPFTEVIEKLLEGKINLKYFKFINLLKFIRLLRLSKIMLFFKDESFTTVLQIIRMMFLFIIAVNKFINKNMIITLINVDSF